MPGVLGVVQRTGGHDVRAVLTAMLAPLQRGGRLRSETALAADNQWALGRIHLGVFQPQAQLIPTEPIQVLFHGELHNADAVRQRLAGTHAVTPDTDTVGLLRALYAREGPQCAAGLHGAFCAVILDTINKRLLLINDRLGSYFLYWFRGPERLVFASELKAVLRDPAVHPTLNPRAIADYLTFGFLFGEKTLAAEVQLLPAATILTYSWEDGSCRLEPYARLDTAFHPGFQDRDAYLAALRQGFNDAVQRTLPGGHQLGLSLSGGLDSRAILSAIDCTRLPLTTYTLGVQGCADEVIAAKLARLAHTAHQFFPLDQPYLGDYLPNLRQMVALTDGMYLTHGLTEMLALRGLEQTPVAVLLRGHGGELAKMRLAWPLHTDARIHAMQSRDDFMTYMLDRVNYISHGVLLRSLFTDDWREQVADGPRLSLEESLAGVNLAPADLCSYLYLTEHHRRYTVASLELFRTLVEVRLPFVDMAFLTTLWQGPALWRDDTSIHQAVTAGNQPALLRVRNSNTGAPGNAGPWLETVCDKLNSLLKRLHIYGYRHYHHFERWMSQTLIKTVEDVLFDAESLARGIYREATLRRLLDETKKGGRDHGYLFQILLIIELWQRDNLAP